MFNVGPFELLAIFVVALLVFGPDKLPEVGQQVGRAVREFRKFQAFMHENARDVIEPIVGPIMPNGPIEAWNPTGSVPRPATVQSSEPPGAEPSIPPKAVGHDGPVPPPSQAQADLIRPAAGETPAGGDDSRPESLDLDG